MATHKALDQEHVDQNKEAATDVKVKKARPFRFDSESKPGKTISLGRYAPIALSLIAIAILGASFFAYQKISASKAARTMPPIVMQVNVDASATPKQNINAEVKIETPALTVAPIAAASASVAANAPLTELPQTPTESDSPQASKSAGQKPDAGKNKIVLLEIEHFRTPLLVEKIDEREVLVKFEDKQYLVKPGQKLPSGDVVFVGFDRTQGVMRTTAGDYRVVMN